MEEEINECVRLGVRLGTKGGLAEKASMNTFDRCREGVVQRRYIRSATDDDSGQTGSKQALVQYVLNCVQHASTAAFLVVKFAPRLPISDQLKTAVEKCTSPICCAIRMGHFKM